MLASMQDVWEMINTVPSRKGPMGGAPYMGSRLGGGPIFEVSLSQLDTKERPGKLCNLHNSHGYY